MINKESFSSRAFVLGFSLIICVAILCQSFKMDNTRITCFQLNANKGVAPTSNIHKHISSLRNMFLYFIQEPRVRKHRIIGLPKDAQIMYKRVQGTIPRTAVVGSKDLNLWLDPRFSTPDLTTCVWLTGNKREQRFYVASLYLDINNTSVVFKELEELVSYCNQNNLPLLIALDSNAHSTIWGLETNPRGERLEEFIAANNLRVENKGKKPTFVARGSETHIDLTLTLNMDNVQDWEVEDVDMSSDHCRIKFNFISGTKRVAFRMRNLKDADWEKFTKKLDSFSDRVIPIWTAQTIELEMKAFMAHIEESLEYACKAKWVKPKHKRPHYWDENVTKSRAETRKAYNAYKRAHDNDKAQTWEKYVDSRKKFKKELKKAKQASWKNFVNEVQDMKSMAKFNKALQNECNETIGLLQVGDTPADNPKDSLKVLIDTHFPGSIPVDKVKRNDYDHVGLAREEDLSRGTKEFAGFITPEKVMKAIRTFSSDKAAGPDGIKPQVLRHFGPRAIDKLTRIYRACITLGFVPLEWRRSRVIFLPKPGKSDYTVPKAFRPISLTSYLFKVLERLVLWELEDTCLIKYPVHYNQHGFRHGSSTESALSAVVDKIEKAVLRGEYALCAFLDISGAFDNLSTASAVEGLKKHGVPDDIIKWYEFYLNNRFINVNIKGIQEVRKLTRGTPQGGVLSPLIWILAFDGLLQLFDTGPINATGYADDASLVIIGKDPFVLRDLMANAINRAMDWGAKNGLTFGAQKTEIVLFHRKRPKSVPTNMFVRGTEIKFSTSAKYLGVILDTKLNFNLHLDHKIKKAKALLFAISKAIGRLWGPSPLVTKWAFTGIIRPMLSYGAVIWGHTLENATTSQQLSLNRLNRLAALMITFCRKGTPTAGLEVIYDLMPLDLFIIGEAIKAGYRIKSRNVTTWDGLGYKPSIQGHKKWADTNAKKLGLTSELDEERPIRIWKKNYRVDKDSFEKGLPIKPQGTVCYTDGSKTNSGMVGWGFCYLGGCGTLTSERGCLGAQATVFQGEICAITQAAKMLLNIADNTIFFFVDSQAALLALDSHVTNNQTVHKCVEALNCLGQQKTIILRWVKAHVGHELNELADNLAKQGSEGQGIKTEVPLSKSIVKTAVKEMARARWNQRWQSRTDCRQTRIWYQSNNEAKSKELLRQGRITLSIIVQFITGFNLLGYHQKHIQGQSYDNLCRLCLEDEESSWHLAAECPALAMNRREIFGSTFLNHQPQWTIKQFVRLVSTKPMNRLLLSGEE